MLTASTGTVKLSLPSTTIPPYIKLNVGQVGLFRVMYTNDGWKQLESAILKGELSPTDRLGNLMLGACACMLLCDVCIFDERV